MQDFLLISKETELNAALSNTNRATENNSYRGWAQTSAFYLTCMLQAKEVGGIRETDNEQMCVKILSHPGHCYSRRVESRAKEVLDDVSLLIQVASSVLTDWWGVPGVHLNSLKLHPCFPHFCLRLTHSGCMKRHKETTQGESEMMSVSDDGGS